MRTSRSRRLATAMTLLLPLLAAPMATADAATDLHVDLTVGDQFADRGARLTAAERARLDAVALDASWSAEGIDLALSFAGRPVIERGASDGILLASYQVLLRSAPRGGDPAASSLSIELGRGIASGRGTGSDARTQDFHTCLGSPTTVDGNRLVVTIPDPCLPTDVDEWWVSVTSHLGDVNYLTGDGLFAGDRQLLDGFDQDLGTVTRPGTTGGATTNPARPAGEPSERSTIADSDPSSSRAVLTEAVEPDDGASDVHEIEVTAVEGGGLRVLVTGADGLRHGLFTLFLNRADGASIRVGLSEVYTGNSYLTPRFNWSGADDIGSHGCTGTFEQGTNSYVIDVAPTCALFGDFTDYQLATFADFDGNGSGQENWRGELNLTLETFVPDERPAATARDISATCDGREPQAQFEDVGEGNPHRPAIECLSSHGITQGRGDGQFGVADPLSHGQIATFLVRTLETAGATLPEDDGTCGGVHGPNLRRLQLAGISDALGCDTSYPVTRSLMAGYAAATLAHLGDVPASETDWFHDDERYVGAREDAHDVIADQGIVTGRTAGEFLPDALLSRAQMATFLARILDYALASDG